MGRNGPRGDRKPNSGMLWGILEVFLSLLFAFFCATDSLFILSADLLPLHLKIHSTKRPTTASQKDQISLSPCFSLSPLILTSGKRFLLALLAHLEGMEWSWSIGSHFTRWQPASCPWGFLGQYKSGRPCIRSPLQEADFYYCRRSFQQH